MRKKLSCIVSSIFLMSMMLFTMPLYANETEMDTKNEVGSITIALEDTQDKLPKENVEFVCVKVADVKEGKYELSNVFEEQKIDLNNIQTSEELLNISWQLKKNLHDIEGTLLKTNKDGVLKFENLGIGVYLVFATDINGYELIYPTLVSIPTFNEVSGQMDYDVTMIPKHSHLPVIQVNKVDSVTNKNIVDKAFAFTLYSDSECKQALQTQHGSETTGIASFVLPYGVYFIKETKAPLGYKLSDEVVKVEITEDGVFVNNKKIENMDDYIYSIRYQNVLLPTVATGDTNDNVMPFIILGLSTVVCIYFAYKRYKMN